MTRFSIFRRGVLGLALATATLSAAPIQWTAAMGGNDNWYEYVQAISIFAPVDFASARSAANASSHMGMPGYLVTITSLAEQAFLESSFAIMVGFGGGGTAYIGGQYDSTEKAFFWQDGPETGQKLTDVKWWPGHPLAGDPNLVLYRLATVFPSVYGVASWSERGAFGYIVEYGDGKVDRLPDPPPPDSSAVPEPSGLLLAAAGLAGLFARRLQGRG